MSDITIKQADFKDDFPELEKIRTTVFIKEQHVPVELEWDEQDAEAIHILAYYGNKPVGTARLLKDGHIGRMAVLKEFRNRSVGKKLLEFMINLAKNKNIQRVELSAQKHAVPFYQKYGFSITSDEYLDAGIPHYTMVYTNKE